MSQRFGLRIDIGKMLLELMAGPCTHAELWVASGLAESTVREWVRDWRKARALRIAEWERTGNTWKPVYGLNPDGLPDVKRHRKMTPEERRAADNLRHRVKRVEGRAKKVEETSCVS